MLSTCAPPTIAPHPYFILPPNQLHAIRIRSPSVRTLPCSRFFRVHFPIFSLIPVPLSPFVPLVHPFFAPDFHSFSYLPRSPAQGTKGREQKLGRGDHGNRRRSRKSERGCISVRHRASVVPASAPRSRITWRTQTSTFASPFEHETCTCAPQTLLCVYRLCTRSAPCFHRTGRARLYRRLSDLKIRLTCCQTPSSR